MTAGLLPEGRPFIAMFHERDRFEPDSSTAPPDRPPLVDPATSLFFLLRLAVEQQAEGLAILDAAGNCLYLNEAHARLFGVEPAELIWKPWRDLFDPAGRPIGGPADISALAAEGPWTGELTGRGRDGAVVSFEASISLLRGPKGDLIGTLVASRDIGGRKRHEQALRESHAILSETERMSKTGHWVWDLRLNHIVLSQEACALYGLEPSLAPFPLERLLRLMHPEDRPRIQSLADQARREGIAIPAEFRVARPDGAIRILAGNGSVTVDADGAPVSMMGTLMDVTEWKHEEPLERHEGTLKAIIDATPECIKLMQADGTLLAMNPAGLRMMGAERGDQAIGRTMYSHIAPEHRDAFKQFNERVCGGSKGTLEFEIVRMDGARRMVETHAVPLKGEGAACLHLAVTRDITERKRLEQRLRQAEKMEVLGSLAGGVAHDFNNILVAILGYTELAMDNLAPDSRARRNLEQVLVAGRRGRSLIHQILSFSRQREPHREAVELDHVLREAMMLLRASIPDTIELRLDERATNSRLSGDPTQLQQVILNLCSNAAQAMQEQGGLLEMTLDEVEVDEAFAAAHSPLTSGPHVRLTVRDTGIGITPEVQARMFDPFFTTKKIGEGTGLGLSAALTIVTSHGGTITVQSEQGRGSTFSVYLPTRSPAAASDPGAPLPDRGGSERILFVDDDVAQARLVEQWLVRLGYRVTAMTDPVLALGQFRQTPDAFDLVMTDYAMPGMTGKALMSEILRLRPHLPVLLYTDNQDRTDAQTAHELGRATVLSKPWSAADVDLAIRQTLNPHRDPGGA